MSDTTRRIVPGEESDLHDEPHLDGRRITVRRLRGLVEGAGKSAQAVAEEFDLDVADVYAALHYYHTHPEEMQEAEEQRRRREQEARETGGKSVHELIEERGDGDGVSDSG